MQGQSNTEAFIQLAAQEHRIQYGYKKCVYVNAHTPVSITCPKHGQFKKTPIEHLSGSGCKKCDRNMAKEDFINRAGAIHDYRFDYSKVKYLHERRAVVIGCEQHGNFEETPANHFLGDGCPECDENEDEDYY